MIKTSNFIKIFKALLKPFAYFILNLLDGYGWRAFLSRALIVIFLFKFNPLDEATHGGPGGGKLWFLTCAILAYAICRLIYDYTKTGKEAEAKKLEAEEKNKRA